MRSIGIVHFEFAEGVIVPPKAYAPRPETSIYFFPRDPEFVVYPGVTEKIRRPPVCVHGQHSVMNHRFIGRNFLALIVHLQPGVLYRLSGLPLEELTNTSLPGDVLLPKEAYAVNQRLGDCQSYAEMLMVLEGFLTLLFRKLKKDAHGVDAAAGHLLQHGGQVSLSWLARETSLSAKQFERKFKERHGVVASTLARLSRFTKTVRTRNTHPELDLLSLALTCGYHDYQHLARDSKAFTGLTPAAFFDMDAKAPERTFGLFEENKIHSPENVGILPLT